jgi:hypothetical protein
MLEQLFLGSLEDVEELAVANPHQIATVITLCLEPIARLGSRPL